MAYVEEAIKTRAGAVSALTDLISTRFYPVQLPEGATMPAVTYEISSNTRAHAMGSDPGMAEPRLRCHAWADTQAVALSVAAALRTTFQDWSATVDGVVIERSFLDNEYDGGYSPGVEGYHSVVEFTVKHLE